MNGIKAAALAAFAGLLVSGPALSQTPITTEKMTMHVGIVDLAPSWSVVIVVAAKLYKPYMPNVTVERDDVMTGMAIVNSMLAGRLDVGYYGDMPSIVLGSKSGLNQTRLVGISEGDDGHEANIYVKKGSTIKTVKDLAGKTVSVPFGGFTHRFAEFVEAKENIKFNLVGQSPEVGLSNMQAGKVDAYMPWHPFGPLSVSRGYATEIADGTKYGFSSLRPIVASKEFLDKHPDVAVAWMRAELDAHRMMREHPDECAKILAEDWKKFSVPIAILRPDFDFKTYPDDIPPKWRKILSDGADFLLTHKYIQKAPDWATYIDDSYIKKAASIPSQMKN